MFLTKVISTTVTAGARIVKFLRNGLKDVQTSEQYAPYGIDSNPIKDMIAIYAATSVAGDTAIIGYLNKNQLAGIGETRLFSTDQNGGLKGYIWLKADGKALINGDADNAVRFIPLNQEMVALQNFINQQLQLIATGITGAGGSYVPGTLSIDISGSKIDEIRTP